MILKRQEKENIIKALYDSSNVLASTYDTESCDLTIIFGSGNQYKYSNVSKSDYMRFEIAESQGKIFNSHIKKYAFEKLDNFEMVEMLTNEATKLKTQEQSVLIESKKLDVINKIIYLYNLTQNDKKVDNDEIFNKNLLILKNSIDIFLAELNSTNNLE